MWLHIMCNCITFVLQLNYYNMSFKKIYYETTEEIRTRTRKGSITVNTDYTQVYDSFSKLSRGIKNGVSFKLLFWLMANKTNKDRGVSMDAYVREDFNRFLQEDCETCSISKRTFDYCIKELVDANALTRIGRGHYYANAYCLWKGPTAKRTVFLQEEAKADRYKMLNPDAPKKIKALNLPMPDGVQNL